MPNPVGNNQYTGRHPGGAKNHPANKQIERASESASRFQAMIDSHKKFEATPKGKAERAAKDAHNQRVSKALSGSHGKSYFGR